MSNKIEILAEGNVFFVNSQLKSHVVQKNRSVKRLVVALHGFGDNALNFSFLSESLKVFEDSLWLFLQGGKAVPFSPGGFEWYPLFEDPKEQFCKSINFILDVTKEIVEKLKLSWDKVFFTGFSQGASLVLQIALASKQKLGGVICISGFMCNSHNFINHFTPELKKTPIFIGHGLQDQTVFPCLFFDLVHVLENLNVDKLVFKTYDIAHEMCAEELNDIECFVKGSATK